MTRLDEALAKAMQLTGAPVLFVAKYPIRYQPGCGVGRPQYGERVLLIHPTDTDHIGTWALPNLDVAGEAQIGAPVVFGDVLLSRCDAEFKPAIDKEKFDVTWTCVDYAVSCANDPQTTAAIQQFLASSGEPQGAMSMESGLSPRDAQQKAQHVHEAFGDAEGAPAVLNGEGRRDYRIRLLSKYQHHSNAYKNVDLNKVQDETAFTAIEDSIYADAMRAVFRDGELRASVTMDAANRPITRHTGRDGALWDRIHPPIRHVRRFNTPGNGLH